MNVEKHQVRNSYVIYDRGRYVHSQEIKGALIGGAIGATVGATSGVLLGGLAGLATGVPGVAFTVIFFAVITGLLGLFSGGATGLAVYRNQAIKKPREFTEEKTYLKKTLLK